MSEKRFRVTDPCRCGHQIIAHSTDGCVYCDCDERHPVPPGVLAEAEQRLAQHRPKPRQPKGTANE